MPTLEMASLAAGEDLAPAGYRRLYVAVLDPEGSALTSHTAQALGREVREAALTPSGRLPEISLEQCRRESRAWAADEADRYRSILAEARGDDARAAVARRALLGCAPLCLRSGAWLQWLFSPANAEDPAMLATLATYASDVGAGSPRRSRGDAYYSAMSAMDIADHATPLDRLVVEEHVVHGAFRVPATMIAMGRRPELFTPEVLGADQCLRAVGLLPPLHLVRELMPRLADWTALDLSSDRLGGLRPGPDVEPGTQDGLEETSRLVTGFRWALGALAEWSEQLRGELAAVCDPAFEMAELVRLRGREASAYHQDFRLADRPLGEMFAAARTDPGPLLESLAASRLVRPGRPDASPLLTGLVAASGPMFRIFSPRDTMVIRRWIASLPAEPAGPGAAWRAASPGFPATVGYAAALDQVPREPPRPARAPLGLRDAYHALQSRAQDAQVRAFAREYTRDWLAACARELAGADVLPPAQWSAVNLRNWLIAQHARQLAEPAGQASDREELIDSTVQLAPMILLDGAWLRGFTDYSQVSTDVGYSLFATYWDELGNGDPALNHPLIYRELLAEMGVRLPPTGSEKFARWPGFREASFRLPVYWLCVGSLPQTLLAETLGLNLAMELSGVGGGYRRAATSLHAHGFSSRFVDIHNTIDNVATGHSAWAVDAICAYMSEVLRLLGAAAQVQAWSRVRLGFRSLTTPKPRRRGRLRGPWPTAGQRPARNQNPETA